jgi:3-oxoacyl-(acyl-carrier-protein) synthase
MSRKVVVTGLGVISAIGDDVKSNFDSLIQRKSGIGKIENINTRHKTTLPFAEIKLSDTELLDKVGVGHDLGYTRPALLGIIAAKEAIEDAGIHDIDEYRTGIISATTVGGMGKTEQYYKQILDESQTGDFMAYISAHDCGESTERIADFLNIKEYINTINTACSSSANAVMLGARLIKHNILDRVVVGGVDSLTLFTINGFNSLMILDERGCRPFSDDRRGLTLGEGAGYIVIEAVDIAQKSNKKIYSEVTGYANTCDAFHQTASSPEGDGAFLSMSQALKVAGLNTSDIDYINAHGTATEINDLSEGRAVQKLFEKVPPISSTKSYTGHTLGASGGIEAVYANLCIQHGVIFPNLSFYTQMNELNFKPQTELAQNVDIKHVLSNSFGFGGNNTTLIFSKISS